MITGALSILAVPVSYFFTTKRQFGPPLAAIPTRCPCSGTTGMSLRPAGLNHFLALVGGIFCAAALDRGRRADGVIAAAARVLAVLGGRGSRRGRGPVSYTTCSCDHRYDGGSQYWCRLALYGVWWVLSDPAATAGRGKRFTQHCANRPNRPANSALIPFYHAAGSASSHSAALLLVAFVAWGVMQLRRGLAAGHELRGVVGRHGRMGPRPGPRAAAAPWDTSTFRYAYLSLGFALLAIVPRRPISWPVSLGEFEPSLASGCRGRRAGARRYRALDARSGLQEFARQNTELGRKAKGTMLVLGLGPNVIPDRAPITFSGSTIPMAPPAGRGPCSTATVLPSTQRRDRRSGARGSWRRPSPSRGNPPTPGCRALDEPSEGPGHVDRGSSLGMPARPSPGTNLGSFAAPAVVVEVVLRRRASLRRRLGPLADVPANHNVFLTLPALDTERLWEIRANGACLIPYVAPPPK